MTTKTHLPNIWAQMSYHPPRGPCSQRLGLVSSCPCHRFMAHPLQATSTFSCDGCGHHASFHRMEAAPSEVEAVKRWREEEEKEEEERGNRRSRSEEGGETTTSLLRSYQKRTLNQKKAAAAPPQAQKLLVGNGAGKEKKRRRLLGVGGAGYSDGTEIVDLAEEESATPAASAMGMDTSSRTDTDDDALTPFFRASPPRNLVVTEMAAGRKRKGGG